MKTTEEKIEEIRVNGYQLDFGNVMNHAFENYKKIAIYAGLILFVITAIIGILIVGILTTSGINIMNQQSLENLKIGNFPESFIMIAAITIIALYFLLIPLPAGLIKMAHSAEKDEEFHLSTLLEYFKAPYYKELLISTLLISLFSSGISMLLSFTGIKMIGTFVSIVVSIFTFLTIPLIIFGDLKAFDAIKSSAMIVSKQPLVLCGLIFVASIGSMVGLIGCCIGVFFTMPLTYSMYYAIYTAIIGIDSESEVE